MYVHFHVVSFFPTQPSPLRAETIHAVMLFPHMTGVTYITMNINNLWEDRALEVGQSPQFYSL